MNIDMKNFRIVIVSSLLLSLTGCASPRVNSDKAERQTNQVGGLLFLNRFDGGLQANVAVGKSQPVENHAGPAPTGIKDEAVDLAKGKWLTFEANRNINPSEGTLSFWVKPNWSSGDAASHCFVYIPLDKGEILISDGYFEGAGGNLNLWFVLPGGTARTMGCKFIKGQWSFVTVTWKTGGQPMIYFNGMKPELVKATKSLPAITSRPTGEIYLGKDGAGGNRWADCEMDEFAVYDKCLNPKQVRSLYREHVSLDKEKENAEKHLRELKNLENARPVNYNDDGKPIEMRMMFFHPIAFSVKDIPTLLDRCEAAGFNALLPEAWSAHGAGWDVSGEEKKMKKNIGKFMTTLVDEAHKRGMKIIPFLNITMATPSTPEDLLIKDKDGKSVQMQGKKKSSSRGWGSVFNPKWRERMCDLVEDLLKKYDVDGIGWDFVRARPDFSEQNRKAYKKYFEGRDYDADMSENIVGGKYPWQAIEWQEKHMLAFLGELRKTVNKVRPNLPVYMFGPSYWPTNSHRLTGGGQGRNMIKALNYGLVDMACLDYPSLSGNLADYRYLKDNLNHPDAVVGHIVNWQRKTPEELKKGGMHVKTADLDNLCAEIGAFRQNWKLGAISFYFYRGLDDEQLERLKTTVFSEPAVWPEKMSPPPFRK